MDLSLSDEQKQLKDAAERFVRDKYTFENRRKIAATERGWLPENWAQFAELGWLGMSFSEEDGGYGGGPIETMIVMEEFGKGLVLEPFLPTVVLGGGLIASAGFTAGRPSQERPGLPAGPSRHHRSRPSAQEELRRGLCGRLVTITPARTRSPGRTVPESGFSDSTRNAASATNGTRRASAAQSWRADA